ncbi:hypothetical protein BJV82DRAFT_609256 [Fennellomyces sp. T-0311]|nr:hypothetical protein BJV82DRAFT_609256 [Fennellomyces sp. T-0311]
MLHRSWSGKPFPTIRGQVRLRRNTKPTCICWNDSDWQCFIRQGSTHGKQDAQNVCELCTGAGSLCHIDGTAFRAQKNKKRCPTKACCPLLLFFLSFSRFLFSRVLHLTCWIVHAELGCFFIKTDLLSILYFSLEVNATSSLNFLVWCIRLETKRSFVSTSFRDFFIYLPCLTMATLTQPNMSSTLLEPFYTDLLESTFPTSQAAIEFCRDLCAQYGFTVKQESSTHRNIYVYCSREGLPDSVRNPKRSPKRKRPSKRCDCKWRVVLNENKETHTWKFRKSNNPDAMIHNHTLMRPEEIERGWPKEVHEMICRLARERMTTQEIRQQVQAQFNTITWNERRFYNRLSEERQKIRQQETIDRAHRLTGTWTKICMAAAGCDELTEFAQTQVLQLLHTVCDMAQIQIDTLEKNVPVLVNEDEPILSTVSSPDWSSERRLSVDEMERRGSVQTEKSDVPKNFTLVVIPKHAYLVKVHNQRSLNEMQIQRTHRRSRSIGPGDEGDLQHLRKQQKFNHPPMMPPSTMPPPSPHRMMPQQQQVYHHPVIYPPPPTYDHNAMSLPPSSPHYIQQQQQQPLQYTMARQHSSHEEQLSNPDDANIAFPPLDTSSSTVASTPSPVSAGTPPTTTAPVISYGPPATTAIATTTTTTTATSSNSAESPYMSVQPRTRKAHRRHSYNNVHPSFQYPMMSPQAMYHQKQVVGMNPCMGGRPDNRQQHHRPSPPMPMPPPQQSMMVSTVPEHSTPRPDQQIPCYGAGNGSYW